MLGFKFSMITEYIKNRKIRNPIINLKKFPKGTF